MVNNPTKTIAFIAGSGLAHGLEDLFDDIKHYKHVRNPFGKVLSYYISHHGNTRVIILPRHGDSINQPARSPAELVRQRGYEANIWQLYKLGVTAVYGFSAVGALDKNIPLASNKAFVVPDDYIRGLAASQHSFGDKALSVHANESEPFDPELRKRAIQSIKNAGYKAIDNGVYIYNGGDTFETKAEIRTLDRFTKGEENRVIGMTTVPEAMLLSQMKIPFAVICSNVNYAEGLSKKTLVSHEQTIDVMEKAAPFLLNIAKEIIERY